MTPEPTGRVLIAHPSADVYGSDRMMLESLSGFIAAGYRVSVAVPQAGPLVPLIQERGGEVVFVDSPVLRKSALSPRGLVALARSAVTSLPRNRHAIRAAGADVVYVSTLTVPLWLVAARTAGVPVTVHVHEAEQPGSRVIAAGLMAPLLLAHRVIVNSAFTESVVAGTLPLLRRRIVRVLNGMAPAATLTPARAQVEDELHIVYVGRLAPRKGVNVALGAVELLHQRGERVQIEVLGSVFPGYEWYETELRTRFAALIDAGVVRFSGFEPAPWAALARADVAVVPSVLTESFGNAAVEAVLAERALVVSAAGALPEVVHGLHTAQVVPIDDVSALADALSSVHRSWGTLRPELAASRAIVEQRYQLAGYRAGIVNATTATPNATRPGGTKPSGTTPSRTTPSGTTPSRTRPSWARPSWMRRKRG